VKHCKAKIVLTSPGCKVFSVQDNTIVTEHYIIATPWQSLLKAYSKAWIKLLSTMSFVFGELVNSYMPFAEPRPHRRPFHAFTRFLPLTVKSTRKGVNLAVTSITLSNQAFDGKFVDVVSRGGDGDIKLMMVQVNGGQTLHLPFPHPLMVGETRKLVVINAVPDGALFTCTVIGYEWKASDDV
jgi:hypothetical protein